MINLHRKYLFSKINLVVVIIIMFIISSVFVFSIKINWNQEYRWLYRNYCTENYLQNMIFTIKFIGIIFSCYLMGSSFTNSNDGYAILFIRFRKDRIKYFFSKFLSLIIVDSCLIGMIFIVGTFILYSFCQWYDNYRMLIAIAFNIITINIVYGLLSVIGTLLLKASFSFIIPFAIFLGIEIMIDLFGDSNYFMLFKTFFPTIVFGKEYYFQIFNILLIILYGLIGGIIYYQKS